MWPRGPFSVQFCSRCTSTTFSISVPKKCEAMGYVDDTKLLLTLSPSDISITISDLNSDLRGIANWCSTNSLLINPNKTKLFVVGVPQLTRNLSLPPVVQLGKNIKPSPVVKDLGIWIDSAVTSTTMYLNCPRAACIIYVVSIELNIIWKTKHFV